MSRKTYLFIAILVVLTALFSTRTTYAVENYQEGPVLFSDDFSQNNLNSWQVLYGNWQAVNNFLIGLDYGQLRPGRINTDSQWSNYRFETDIQNVYGIDEGLGFRWTDQSGYEVTMRHGTGQDQTPEIILNKTVNGQTTQLFDTHSVSLENYQTYHIKIEAVGEHLQMWVDSTPVFDLDDPGTTIQNGQISLSYWTGDVGISNVRFDNVKVTSLYTQRFPVIFIPGIGGSELQANQDIIWSKDNGHGGIYSHAYRQGDTIWVNPDEAISLGDDDYFDVLKLDPYGQTSQADIGLTGEVNSYGYGEVNQFFNDLGYQRNSTYYIYNYDWRKDVKDTQADLDTLVEHAKQTSGQPKVNIISHSLGGLVARNYISDPTHAAKVNKNIEMGVPHLGTPWAIKALTQGAQVGPSYLFGTISLNSNEVKDVVQNFPSAFELTPSSGYYNFYNNSNPSLLYPFRDDRDIDNDHNTGFLSYSQTKNLLQNLNLNMTAYGLSENFHNNIDPTLNQTNGVTYYEIVGSGQPTLGQIRETWWIAWPTNLFPKEDEVFINGDDTVPLYSASLKSDSLDLSANARIYYVDQKHGDMPLESGPAMQTVKMILEEGDTLPVSVANQKITLSGTQISADNNAKIDLYDSSSNHTGVTDDGSVEENIPGTLYDSSGSINHAFIKSSAGTVQVHITTTQNSRTDLKIRHYSEDNIDKTSNYVGLPTDDQIIAQFSIDPTSNTPPTIVVGDENINPTNQVDGDEPPVSPQTSNSNNTGPSSTNNSVVVAINTQPSASPSPTDSPIQEDNLLSGIETTTAAENVLGNQSIAPITKNAKDNNPIKLLAILSLVTLLPLFSALGFTFSVPKKTKK